MAARFPSCTVVAVEPSADGPTDRRTSGVQPPQHQLPTLSETRDATTMRGVDARLPPSDSSPPAPSDHDCSAAVRSLTRSLTRPLTRPLLPSDDADMDAAAPHPASHDLAAWGRALRSSTAASDALRATAAAVPGAPPLASCVADAADLAADAYLDCAARAEQYALRSAGDAPPSLLRVRSLVADAGRAISDADEWLRRRLPALSSPAALLAELAELSQTAPRPSRPFFSDALARCAVEYAAAAAAWTRVTEEPGAGATVCAAPDFVLDRGAPRTALAPPARSAAPEAVVSWWPGDAWVGVSRSHTDFADAADRFALFAFAVAPSVMSLQTALDVAVVGAAARCLGADGAPRLGVEWRPPPLSSVAIRDSFARAAAEARQLAEAELHRRGRATVLGAGDSRATLLRVIRDGLLLGDSDVATALLSQWSHLAPSSSARTPSLPTPKSHEHLRLAVTADGGSQRSWTPGGPGVRLDGAVSTRDCCAFEFGASGGGLLRLRAKFRAENALRITLEDASLLSDTASLTVRVLSARSYAAPSHTVLAAHFAASRVWITLGSTTLADAARGHGTTTAPARVTLSVELVDAPGKAPPLRRVRATWTSGDDAVDVSVVANVPLLAVHSADCAWADAFGLSWCEVAGLAARVGGGVAVDTSSRAPLAKLAWSVPARHAQRALGWLLDPDDVAEDLQGPFHLLLELKRTRDALTAAWARLKARAAPAPSTTDLWRTRAAMAAFCDAVESHLQLAVAQAETAALVSDARRDGLSHGQLRARARAYVATVTSRCALADAAARRALLAALDLCRAFAETAGAPPDAATTSTSRGGVAADFGRFSHTVRGFARVLRRVVSEPSAASPEDAASLHALLLRLDVSGFYAAAPD